MVGLVCLGASGCAGATATGAEAPPERRDRAVVIADVLELSGTQHGAQSLEGALRRIVAALSGSDTFGDTHLVRPVLEREITARRLYGALETYVGSQFDAERFDRLLGLLRQPLVQRMTALEIASIGATPEAVKAWREKPGSTDDGRARLALARRIDAAVGATEVTMEILFAAGRGVVRALREGAPSDRRLSLDHFRADMAKLEPDTREETVASLAFTYRQATAGEITRYAELLETGLARWFSRIQRDAAAQAAETITESAIRKLIDARRAPRV